MTDRGTPLTIGKLRRALRLFKEGERLAAERWVEWNKLTAAEQLELMARPLPLHPDQKAGLDRVAGEIARELFR